MNIYLVHDFFDNEHLEAVKKEMETLGAPKIRAFYVEEDDSFVALEGCHRLRAAKELGLIPEIVEIDYELIFDKDVMDESLNLDLDNPGSTVEELFFNDFWRRESIQF